MLPKNRPPTPPGEMLLEEFLVHDYMDVYEDVVWKTSVEEIPRLVALLEAFGRS